MRFSHLGSLVFIIPAFKYLLIRFHVTIYYISDVPLESTNGLKSKLHTTLSVVEDCERRRIFIGR